MSSFFSPLPLLEKAYAATFTIPGSAGVSIGSIIGKIIGFLQGLIVAFCTAIFAIGALSYILGAGKEDMQQKGKTMMIGALIGLAVVVGAPAILRTFLSIIG